MGGQPRRAAGADRRRARRRYRLAERGVYLMDLTLKITRDELRRASAANLDAEEALRAKGKRLFAPIAAGRSRRGRGGVGRPHLRLREGAVRLRLEAHHAAGQQARVRISFGHLQVLRLPAGDAVVRRPRRAGGQTGQRARDAQGHRQPRAGLRGQQPLRLGRRSGRAPTTTRPARRPCSKRRGSWRSTRSRRRSSSRRSREKKRACSAAASSSGRRWRTN